ncbi:MAG: type II toxin-antitoxin system HicA family toxin [Pyrinomonadaceae bacterium]
MWNPCKRNDFIRRPRRLGFDGPYSGSKHQFPTIGHNRLTVPSNSEYSVPKLRFMLREIAAIIGGEISEDEWNGLK